MLLQKVNVRTWGYLVVVGRSLYLLYYSFQIQLAWWLAQLVVADSNLVYQQVLIGIIGFVIIDLCIESAYIVAGQGFGKLRNLRKYSGSMSSSISPHSSGRR